MRDNHDDRIARLATLTVDFAANVQPGQIVGITSGPGKEALTHAVAELAYQRGAKFVDLFWFDSQIKRSRIEHADEETLDYVPPWYGQRALGLGEHHAARIAFSPPVDPDALDGLNPAHAGRDRLPVVKETLKVIADRSTNWAAVPCPTQAWAHVVFPELDGDAALERLWAEVEHICRLDEDDPVAAWRDRMSHLDDIATRLTASQLDSLHLEGPGTNLTVGLLPSSRWTSAMFSRADGLPHLVNLPSEELFSTPDPTRVDGFVTATRPLVLQGAVVEGIRVRFEGGRAVSIDADSGAEALRSQAARDEGASRLGEIALVDAESRIGRLGTTFYDTLVDENAASHIALGQAYSFTVDEADRPRANRSEIHVDFMIGSNEVGVTGMTQSGERIPVLVDGAWQL